MEEQVNILNHERARERIRQPDKKKNSFLNGIQPSAGRVEEQAQDIEKNLKELLLRNQE
jgi:hypothetical protein